MELASSLINPEYSYEEVDNQIPAVEPTYGSTVNLNNNNLSGDDEPWSYIVWINLFNYFVNTNKCYYVEVFNNNFNV